MIATVNWQYTILRWPVGGVYRVKRRSDGPPPLTDMGVDTVNNDFWTRMAPASINYSGDQYNFAFWSITAADMLSPQQEAHIESSRTASSSHPGTIANGGGQWTITAKAFYVRDFGGGPGDHGVFIDAFDIQAGDFIGDDFVNVIPDDPAHSLTTNANNGYINTTTQIAPGNAITIKALDQVNSLSIDRVFAYWHGIDSMLISGNPATPPTVGAPDPHDIVAHNNDIIYGFAFYNETGRRRIRVPDERLFDPWWWIKTHGGLTPPGPDPEPWMLEAIAAFRISLISEDISSELRVSLMEIALEQLSISSNSLKSKIRTIKKKTG